MNNLELVFNMLGEASTTEITKVKNSQCFDECKDLANKGGNIAGNARKDLEKQIGKTILSKKKFKSYNKKKQLE